MRFRTIYLLFHLFSSLLHWDEGLLNHPVPEYEGLLNPPVPEYEGLLIVDGIESVAGDHLGAELLPVPNQSLRTSRIFHLNRRGFSTDLQKKLL